MIGMLFHRRLIYSNKFPDKSKTRDTGPGKDIQHFQEEILFYKNNIIRASRLKMLEHFNVQKTIMLKEPTV